MTPFAIASLAMYPFPQVRDAWDNLWGAVRSNLPGAPPTLEWTVQTPDVWGHPDLLVAQACGWPLVTALTDRVCVVGAFDHDVEGAKDGTYCSVLVTDDPAATLHELMARPGVVAAVNSFDSLSGRVSLEHVWGGLPVVLETGAHLESVRALAAHRAQVASIDAVSWALISDLYPDLVEELRVVGAGPRVGCLPIVTPWSHAAEVPRLRAAFAAAVEDATVRDDCRRLHIRGFVAKDLADYLPVRNLVG